MQKKNLFILLLSFLIGTSAANAQPVLKVKHPVKTGQDVTVGAQRTDRYFPVIAGKRVAVVGNHTSLIGNVHLVDSLKNAGISVKKVFSPEHGFRGDVSAGELIGSSTDPKTGIPIVSLYGKNKKPTLEQLADIDIVIFDIQDVGARFYTYISTMTLVMEACAEKKIPMIVLDRPNPNGHYIDGPVLEKQYASFVGMHPVPVVHGMTIGEYAGMVNGEGWLTGGIRCDLTVIPCLGYDHTNLYQVPVKPSPNLNSMEAIYLYPSICFFEGTSFSVGRGTDKPFRVIGHPDFSGGPYSFTPVSMPGASKDPKHEGVKCNGYDLSNFANEYIRDLGQVYVFWLLDCYQRFGQKDKFFTSYFNTLAGTATLKEQIIRGASETEIRDSWKAGISKFREIRRKYLLYKDFE